MALKVIEYRQLVQILALFMIVQFGGLLLSTLVFNNSTYQQVQSAQVISSPASAVFYIAYIVFFSVLLLLILKFYKGIFRLVEGLVIFIASFEVFLIIGMYLNSSVSISIFGSAVPLSLLLAVALAILFVVAKNKWPNLKNTAAIVASIGVGVILGVGFSFTVAFIFMVILAVYDFIAVFVTKHMITLANAVSEKNLAFMVDVKELEAVSKSNFSSKELKAYRMEMRKAKISNPAFKTAVSNGLVPVSASVALGTGDLAMPLMVAVSAFKVYLSFTFSMFIAFGAIIGLVLTMLILKRFKRALPAIPPLLFGIIIGILLYYAYLVL